MSLQNVNFSPQTKFFKIETPKRNNRSLQPSERVLYSNATTSPIGSGIFNKTQIRESKSVTKLGMSHSKLFLPSITPLRTSISIRDLSDRKSFDFKPSLKKINDEDRQFMRYFQLKFEKSKNVKDALDSSHDSDFLYQKNMSLPDVDLDLLENKNIPQVVRDNKKKNTVGQFTQIHFLDHQKQINKIIQENQMFKVNDSVYTNLIKSQEKVNLLPRKLGVIKQKGLESLIQLNHYSLGDKYAQAFSQCLQSDDIKDKIKKIELMNNGLTDKGTAQILNSLSYSVELLNLSQNTVGVESANKLIMILRNYQNSLSNLNLDNTKLGDQNAIKVLEALKKLRILDLSNNRLTDECSSALSNCISTRCPLIELYLHWNRLTGISGEKIAKALFDNSNLRVLDLSNNSLGLQNGENCAKAFQLLFAQGESDLIHIDLSNNRWTKDQIQIIQEGINQNKTIYGFHIDSKFSQIDEFGFLNIVQSDQDLINNLVQQENLKQILAHTDTQQKQIMSLSTIQSYATNHQRINGLIPLSYNQKTQSDYISDSVKQNACWICQGWSEQNFVWRSGESGMSYEGPIYILFNFNSFRPIPMTKDENGNFVSKIMCPPTKQLQYFFSTPDGDTHAKDQPCIKNKNPILKDISFGSQVKRDIIIKFLNVKAVNKFEQCLFSKYGEPIHITIQPREEILYPLEKPKPKKKWQKETSVFGKYQIDNQIILEKAMDADWNNSKIPRFVKDQNDRTKLFELMKPHYEGIKALYKYYSSFSPIGDVWAISKLLFTEIFTKSGLVDNKTLKLADLEIKFISSKTQQKKARSLIPERGMVRHEFFEGIIRIAEEKYMINGDCTTYSEAVTHLLNDGFLKVIAEVENPNLWRDERYWNQECDFCYKYYMQILMSIFENYENTIRTSLPTSKYLNLFEFKKIFTDTSILSDEHANERHINIAFNFSVQTQADEVYDERILQLHFIEFLEAIARAAEKFSLPPYKKKNKVYNDGLKEQEMSWEERQQQPLHKKIENLIRLIFYEALPPEKSDQFELHELSIFDQKEINETTTAPLRVKSNFASKINQQPVDGQKPAGLQKMTELIKKTLKLSKQ
ncbi:hypothetical protein ABPG72_007930 [Tetrahymena utriculariae]